MGVQHGTTRTNHDGEVAQWRDQFEQAGYPTARTHVRNLSAWSKARMAQKLVTDMPNAPEAKADALGVVCGIKEATQ